MTGRNGAMVGTTNNNTGWRMERLTPNRNRSKAFTLVELLVVITIITILLGLGAVALTAGRRSAIKQGAVAQLQRIDTALEAFKQDFRDYPPLVTIPGKGPFDAPAANERLYRPDYQQGNESASVINDRLRENRFASRYSLAVYLLGVGDLNGDGMRNYNETDMPNEDDGLDGPGFRDIGKDRFWGLAQDPSRDAVANSGRTYGPYLDPADLGELLVEERINSSNTTGRYVINDPFGKPILYYRNWTIRDDTPQRRPSILRVPAELRSLDSLAAQRAGDDAKALDIDRQLLGASFALLSAGFDGEYGGADQDLEMDLDLSNDTEYSQLRQLTTDNLRVFK